MSTKAELNVTMGILVMLIIAVVLLLGGLSLLILWTTASEETYMEIQEITYAKPLEAPPSPSDKIPPVSSGPTEPRTEAKPAEKPDCTATFSCDYNFIVVPLGTWPDQNTFDEKAAQRMGFFFDISPLKFTKVGSYPIPLSLAAKCNLAGISANRADDHLRIKSCADKYADTLGISYQRAVGLSYSYEGGRAFFHNRGVFVSLGDVIDGENIERAGLVAHELGHSYNLCDEYSFLEYTTQDKLTHGCENLFPEKCTKGQLCLGNTPVFREYAGSAVPGVCQGLIKYSIMGANSGRGCGYHVRGYHAIGGVP